DLFLYAFRRARIRHPDRRFGARGTARTSGAASALGDRRVECAGGRMERRAARGRRDDRTRTRHGDAYRPRAARPRVMMEPSRYLALYLARITPVAPDADVELPSLELRNWYLDEHEVESPPLSLPQLYRAGVECGHTEARLELKRRVAQVNEQIDEYRRVRDKAQDDREHLAADLLLS